MKKSLEICVSYENVRKLLIVDLQSTFDVLKQDIRKYFGLDEREFQLIELKRNAEIISIQSLKEENEVQIVLIQNTNSSVALQNSHLNESNIVIEFGKVDLHILIGKNFELQNMLDEINKWANQMKFNMIFGSKQQMKNGVKRVLSCSLRSFPSRIIMKSNKLKFILLDHDLNFEKKSNFTDQIINDIDLLKGKVKKLTILSHKLSMKNTRLDF